ncbi:MAG: protein-export chaperone SecB [Faecalimonas sp.]|nr:protein-export chaperone SecB [Faecalimonas sp.]
MKESLFQFTNPKILSFELVSNPNFDEESFEGFSIANNVEISEIEAGKKALVILSLQINNESDEYPFYISTKICAMFKHEGSKKFDSLLKINAPALLLSYIRPIISMMTVQSGFEALNIPFINFTDQ